MRRLSIGTRIAIGAILVFAASFVALAVYGAMNGDTARPAHLSALSRNGDMNGRPG